MSENYSFYSLENISKWPLSANCEVMLPPLQRGFVWKANQIEALWDSLLRGFPIGSFLLSKSENYKYELLDGQQRATSVAIGFYDPWNNKEENKLFGALKKIPIVWIDLTPKEITEYPESHKFVIRVITQSHPWGYQRISNDSILGISDRRKALKIFRENIANKEIRYTQFPLTQVYPYDADLPVPLPFVLNAIKDEKENWKEKLIKMCEKKLSTNLKTKYFEENENYIEKIKIIDFNSGHLKNIFNAVTNLKNINIPGLMVSKKVLLEDDKTDDPTLFIRFNRAGTRIAGEELMYSIYKAILPETKDLVEKIGADYIAPSRIISLVSRIVLSEIEKSSFPNTISVIQFKKRIKHKEDPFRKKLEELIGNEKISPVEIIFTKAIKILYSEGDDEIPAVLIKKIINESPDLFLMLLYWFHLNDKKTIEIKERKKIIAIITCLSFFGLDNSRYVRELWKNIKENEFWNNQTLRRPFIDSNDFIMYPLQPNVLRNFLIEQVVNKNSEWGTLSQLEEINIVSIYRTLLIGKENKQEYENNAIYGIFYFIDMLRKCKPLVLFAQRKYINERFPDFNQMETIEDTNVPWDWDHIYPESWVYNMKYVNTKIRDWNYSIGNLRALSLDENRSENNKLSPHERLQEEELRKQSFVKENDWEFWEKIKERIYDDEKVIFHSRAIINRMVNIYKEWYNTFNVRELLDY